MSYILKTKYFDPERLLTEESLFHTANGYLGVRANFEEGYPEGMPEIRGTYISGFYDTHPIHHPEKLYGFPEIGERIVNVTDAQGIQLTAEGEAVVLRPERLKDYERCLDMRRGLYARTFTLALSSGGRVKVSVRRMASFSVRELFAVEYRVESPDRDLDIEIESRLDGDVENAFDPSDPRVSGKAFKPLRIIGLNAEGLSLEAESLTQGTGFSLAVVSRHEFSRACAISPSVGACAVSLRAKARLRAGEELVLVRKSVFADSSRHPEPMEAARALADSLERRSFSELAEDQRGFLDAFWEGAGIDIRGDERSLRALRFNVYQLLQSAPADGRSGVPAKGLSGEGYEGHCFWDTEIYMEPFFDYAMPGIARGLLSYRHRGLEAARTRARELGQSKGAAFPWRTIAGRECSAYYPSGSAQYHINADIAYAAWRYLEATGDTGFLKEAAAELFFETARTWMEIGHFGEDGRFRIECVTGPDEYSCLVDNNYYTNLMSAKNLSLAAEAYRLLEKEDPGFLSLLCRRIGLGAGEAEAWAKAAAAMRLPYDEALGINPQDDGFLRKAVWDLGKTPPGKKPLLLHYHHMVLGRYQVCKQADVVLAHLLLGDGVPPDTMRKSFAYYERITTHDSSLSYAPFGAIAARLGDADAAYGYFTKAVGIDLEDSHGNAKDGLHAANSGGSWMILAFGFGGFRPRGEGISVSPLLPSAWEGFSFRLRYRGRLVEVGADREGATLLLISGSPIDVEVYGRARLLESALRESFPAAGDTGR